MWGVSWGEAIGGSDLLEGAAQFGHLGATSRSGGWMLGYWDAGILGCWDVVMLGCWMLGYLDACYLECLEAKIKVRGSVHLSTIST